MAVTEAYLFNATNREDLQDVIFNIDPVETPFISACRRGQATNKKHEWLIDTLVAAGLNINAEGADYTASYDTRTVPDRVFNYTQIWAKNLSVTGTQEAINHAGRKSELAFQMAKMGLEIRRDMEFQMLSGLNTADAALLPSAVEGDWTSLAVGDFSGTPKARVCGSVITWIYTNHQEEGTGADVVRTATGQPNDDSEVGPGAARAFLESQLKQGIRDAYSKGGNPSYVFVDPFNKQAASAFTGGATRYDQSEDKRLVTAVDIYVSDFGEHMIVPDRFLLQQSTTATHGVAAYILDMSKWAIHYLRPFHQKQLAEIGDAENRVLLAEATLVSMQEAASAVVRDLTDGT